MKIRIAILAACAGTLALAGTLAHAGETISDIPVGLEGDPGSKMKPKGTKGTTVKSSKSNTTDRMGGGGGAKGAAGKN
jgi:hypothetical protein